MLLSSSSTVTSSVLSVSSVLSTSSVVGSASFPNTVASSVIASLVVSASVETSVTVLSCAYTGTLTALKHIVTANIYANTFVQVFFIQFPFTNKFSLETKMQ